MNSGAVFRPATREDARKIAGLFAIALSGVAEYVRGALAPQSPGPTPLEIGERRYAREEGAFSYKNCTFAELGGEVIGTLHAFPMKKNPRRPTSPLPPYCSLTRGLRFPAATT